MKKKKLLSLMLVCIMVFSCMSFLGCAQPAQEAAPAEPGEDAAQAPADDGTVYTFKMVNQAPPGDPQYESFVYLEQILEERSNGRIDVTYYPNSTLGSSNQEQTEMVIEGGVQFTTCPGFTFTAIDGSLNAFCVTDFPFLFQSDAESFNFYDSDLNADMRAAAQAKLNESIIIYPAFNMGWYSIYSNKNALHVPADLSGQKIRVSVNDLYVRVFEAWGCSATPVSWTEVYTSLQQGVCDGISTPTLLFNIQKFYEVQKHMVVLNYGALSHYPVLNSEWYNSLPADLKEIFDGCIADYLQWTRNAHTEAEAAAVDAIAAAGVDVYVPTAEEKQLWIDAVVPIWDELADYCGAEIMASVREMNNR